MSMFPTSYTNLVSHLLVNMTMAVDSDSVVSVPELARKALAATVSLEVQDEKGRTRAQGSGFFVDFDVIATNFHVIHGSTQGLARLVNTQSTYPIEGIIVTDEANDLALLRVKGLKSRESFRLPSATATPSQSARPCTQ